MIKFEGNISGKTLEDYFKAQKKNEIRDVLFVSILFIIASIVMYKIFNMHEVLFVGLASTLMFVAVASLMPLSKKQKKNYKELLPCKLEIDSDSKKITIQNEVYTESILFNKITNITDFGDYYLLISTDHTTRCQKSLLVEGTIEEFEKLFEGKIIKK
jgi:hypothetical protein